LPYLDLVRPIEFQQDSIEALFFDEFNRAHKKVRNAVMELIQFKSINGKKFNNLKIIWAAINPDEEGEYDVEPLDPAQKDRFHVVVEVPYKPDLTYFTDKYGDTIARASISWWRELPDEQKKLVSPRRLDYALDMHAHSGDVRDVLPTSVNVSKLLGTLKTGPIIDRLQQYMNSNDKIEGRSFLDLPNNFSSAICYIVANEKMKGFFLPLVSEENLSSLLAKDAKACDFILDHIEEHACFETVVKQMLNANQNKKLCSRIKSVLSKRSILHKILPSVHVSPTGHIIGDSESASPMWGSRPTAGVDYATMLEGWTKTLRRHSTQTNERYRILKEVSEYMPSIMTSGNAVTTLKFFGMLLKRSQVSTIKHWDKQFHLINLVNHCINQISKAENIGWTSLHSRYGSAFPDLLMKLSEANLASKIFCPSDTPKYKIGSIERAC
jgi:hypothetical protein